MAEQPGLDVVCLQRLPQERVVVQIDLFDRKIVGGPPIPVQLVDLVGRRVLACVGSASALSSVSVGIVLAMRP